MLYLLDANVLIDADRDYYPIERVPEFWEWLVYNARIQRVKIPQEMYDDILAGSKSESDDLIRWMKGNSQVLRLDEDANQALVSRVTNEGYASDLSDEEVDRVSQDPFLIAYPLAHREQRTVVTTEVSKPSREHANRHIPDVCDSFNILHCNTFQIIKTLDFRTRRWE